MPRSSPINSQRSNRPGGQDKEAAFTLVELLVAIAIVAFLVVLLAQILSSAQGIWRTSETRIDAFRDARAAIELMSRDLTFALTNDRAPVLSLSNVFTQTNDAVGLQHNQQVYALIPTRNNGDPAPVTPTPTPSPAPPRTDICAIGFYCSWDASRHAYVLRKHVLQSNPTFSNLQTAFGPATPTPPPSPSPVPTGAPIAPSAVYRPSDPAISPAEDEDVAAYVWDLKVVPWENINGVLTANTTYPLIYRASLPEFIDISFKAFSPAAARQLEAQNVGPDIWFGFETNNAIYQNQILPHVQVFTARIRLQNARTP